MRSVTQLGEGLLAGGSDEAGRGVDAAIWRSEDGLDWQRVVDGALAGPNAERITDVVEGSESVVAVGIDANLAGFDDFYEIVGVVRAAAWVSVDGVAWGRVDVPAVCPDQPRSFPQEVLWGVAAGGPGFVGVGNSTCFTRTTQNASDAPQLVDSGDNGTDAAVWTSVDGSSWQRVEPAQRGLALPGDQGMEDVVVRDGTVVAVGWSEEENVRGLQPAAWVSRDGLVWVRAPDQPAVGEYTTACMNSVVATEEGFVAVGSASDDFMGRGTTDGPACTPPPEAFRTQQQEAAAWYSEDGLNWSPATIELGAEPAEVVAMTSVAMVAGRLIAVGFRARLPDDRDAMAWESNDGKTWRQASGATGTLSRPDIQEASDVTSGGPGAVAVGRDGTILEVDAAIWTSP
jgi:hypothetical protein